MRACRSAVGREKGEDVGPRKRGEKVRGGEEYGPDYMRGKTRVRRKGGQGVEPGQEVDREDRSRSRRRIVLNLCHRRKGRSGKVTSSVRRKIKAMRPCLGPKLDRLEGEEDVEGRANRPEVQNEEENELASPTDPETDQLPFHSNRSSLFVSLFFG